MALLKSDYSRRPECTFYVNGKVNKIALKYIVVITRLAKKTTQQALRTVPDDCMYLLGQILKVCCSY